MSQEWFVKDGKRRQSNAKQYEGLVWKIKFARYVTFFEVLSYQPSIRTAHVLRNVVCL